MVPLGAAKDPLVASTGTLVGDERAALGSLTGSAHGTERTFDFSVPTGARPRVETMPLGPAAEGLRGNGPRARHCSAWP